MTNGLLLDLDAFKKLPTKEQLCVLYENQVKTLEMIRGYRFRQYIQWAWLSALTMVGGYLFNFVISK